MTAALAERFAHNPLASDSAQFPLGPHHGPAAQDAPSPVGARPWGLAGMRPARCQGDPLSARMTYDHARQIAVDTEGRGMSTVTAASAKSTSNNDGDEGPSEDYTYDFTPDQPFPI